MLFGIRNEGRGSLILTKHVFQSSYITVDLSFYYSAVASAQVLVVSLSYKHGILYFHSSQRESFRIIFTIQSATLDRVAGDPGLNRKRQMICHMNDGIL